MSRRLKLLWLLMALLFLVGMAQRANASTERKLFREINQARLEHGVPPLKFGPRIAAFAEHHAREMRGAGAIYHSNLSFPKPPRWQLAGENVGVGDDIVQLARAFMRSPEHRRNELNRVYRRVGIGVVRGAGRLWVSVEFVG